MNPINDPNKIADRVVFKLGNIFKKNLEHNACIDQRTETLPDSSLDSKVLFRDPQTTMEGTGTEDDESMDFETGIDLWVIDKDEMHEDGQIGSSKLVSSEIKAMNKENIITHKGSTNNQSLRCFRVRKTVNYQELSSDSEGDSRKNIISSLDSTKLTKFGSANIVSSLHNKRRSSSGIVKEKRRCAESLSSEEISLLQTEGSSSSDSIQEKNRETLLSIENVGSSDKKRDLFVPSRTNLSCSVCSYSCDSVEELRSHEGNQHNQIFNNCESAWESNLKSFENHLIGEGSLRLNRICNQSKNKGSVLRPASNSDDAEKSPSNTYFCHVCSSSFQEQLTMKTHQILFHSEMKILQCEYCEYKTSQCANLATHIRVHFLLNCPYCDFNSSFKTSFKNHLLTHHNNPAVYKCKKCPYENHSKFLFQKHIKLHEHSPQYKCDNCNKVFSSRKILHLHQRKHRTKERLFKCSYCSLSFSGKQSLRTHEISHKPKHVCGICNSIFNKKGLLEMHMKVHDTDTFTCYKCGSDFHRKYHLIRHMSEHELEITKCKHCTFTCFSDNDISKHNCINKLYNVQRRSLNFKNVSKSNATKKPEVIEKEKQTKLSDGKKIKNKLVIKTNEMAGKLKKEDSAVKVLSRCKNLPSCKSQRISEHRPNINKHIKGYKQNTKVREGKKQNSSNLLKEDTRPESRLRKRHSNNQQTIVAPTKKSRKNESTNHLDIAKMLFRKKPTSVVEVTSCSNEKFVHCSNHNHTYESHRITQLNQNHLRSCGKCMFKTNDKQLLEAHINQAHMWSPEIIHSFFHSMQFQKA